MKWANFLHIYQPAEQQKDILEAIVAQSYLPLFTHIKNNKKIRLTLNVTGSLLEILDKYGHREIIDILREVGKDGRLEFTGSAKYHAFLPFLSEQEIIRQIEINNETNRFYLGDSYKPQGFFPPEMGYTKKLVPIINQLGFTWIILDEIALGGEPGNVDYTKIYNIHDTQLSVFFRERRLSNLIMSAVARSAETLLEAIENNPTNDQYILTAMDGETFGHHRPGLEKMLFEAWADPRFELLNISDLFNHYTKRESVELVDSTWASSKADIERGVQFLSWSDPENIIHTWQSKLVGLVTKEVYAMEKDNPQFENARKKLDLALASDHFWWASAKPWWSLEMIEDGAYRLLDTLRSIPNIKKETLDEASMLYEQIISNAFNWQRTGKIRDMMKSQGSLLRIPFKDRTIGVGGAEEGVYHAFISMMKELETTSAQRGEYEQAILWRDAIFKLENKLDIYGSVNAINLLRIKIPHEEVEKTIEQYKEKYRAIRGGQPEQRGA